MFIELPLIKLSSRLTDIFVRKLMTETNALRLMLDRLPIHNSMLELFKDCFMNCIALKPLS